MKVWRRFVCAGLAAAMLLSPMTVSAAETDAANVPLEVVPIQDTVQDMPSAWALRDVVMAEAYGFGGTILFSGFRETITEDQFILLFLQFCEGLDLEIEDFAVMPNAPTRGFIIDELYNAACKALGVTERAAGDALQFYVDNGYIVGNGKGDYALERACTTQEAVVLAKRLYEHTARALGFDSTGFLWKVTDEDSAIYLLGSIHIANYGMYPLSAAQIDAYDQSVTIVMEVNMTEQDVQDITALIAEQGTYPEGESLADALSEEDYARVIAFMSALGYAEEAVRQMRPWYIEQLISAYAMSAYTAIGIDMFYTLLAMVEGKPVFALETAASQIAVMASLSEESQVTQLLKTMYEADGTAGEMLEQMLTAWYEGDEDAMKAVIGREEAADEASLEFFEKFNAERNKAMIVMIEQVLAQNDQDVMIIVGTMHMLYDDGIVQAMQDLGYTVERIQ